MENRILHSSLINQGLFWAQEVASLTIIILPKMPFSTKLVIIYLVFFYKKQNKNSSSPTVFFDSNGESSFTFILDNSRAFLGSRGGFSYRHYIAKEAFFK